MSKVKQVDQSSSEHSATCEACNREFPLLLMGVHVVDVGLTCGSCLEKIRVQKQHDEKFCGICGVLLEDDEVYLCEACDLDDF